MSLKSNFPSVEISGISFYILGDKDNDRDSYATIKHSEAYRDSEPSEGGPMALTLGAGDDMRCMTCLYKRDLCPGHPGILKLKYPVLAPLFLKKHVIKWLKIICSSCGNIKISDGKVEAYAQNHHENLVKLIAKNTYTQRKNPECAHCHSINYKYTKDSKDHVTIWQELYKEDVKGEKSKLIHKDIMYPHEIEAIFNMITDETLQRLNCPLASHPRKFIINYLRVPPNSIRPSVNQAGSNRVNKDDLTKLLQSIININNGMPDEIPEIITPNIYQEIQKLSAMIYEFHKGSEDSTKGVKTNSRKPLKSILQRLPKKQGQLRRNLMGSRTWYIARSIITCDISMAPDEIGLPIRIAKNITQPMYVQSYNFDQAMVYFMNGSDIYPGCVSVVRGASGIELNISKMKELYQLEIGDIIHRNVISGDRVNFNRQPSLEPSSISSMKVVVHGTKGDDPMDTIRMNVISCPLYNADFDGDEMNVIFIQSSRTSNEIEMLASPQERFISYKNASPVMGQSQDNLIGCVELTRHNTKLDKKHAMRLLANTNITHDFSQYEKGKLFTGQDIISIALTESGNFISYEGRPKMYNSNLEQYRKYNENDINVKIIQGKHISGILDKNSVGEGANSGIYHSIASKYNAQQALTAIYNMQQMAIAHTLNKGITIRAHDAVLSRPAMQAIHEINENMFAASRDITDKLNAGELVAPLGKTITEYYETLQLNALNPGDEFWPHIFTSIDENHNYLLILPDTGVRGKSFNFIQSSCCLGQLSVNGGRLPEELAGRAMPYFTKQDPNPMSRGYIPDSFVGGLSPASYWSSAFVSRVALIDRSCSTAVTGEENRKAIKNLESQVVNYLRHIEKPGSIIQFLYGGDGVDPRFIEEIRYYLATLNDKDFTEQYKCTIDMIDKKYHNKNVEKLLADEFLQLSEDRNIFREKFIKREINTGRTFNFKFQTPINIYRIMMDVRHSHPDGPLDIVSAISKVKDALDNLVYVHTNEQYEYNKKYIPKYLRDSISFIRLTLRGYLCIRNLMKMNISDLMLDKILIDCKMVYLKSLIDYGKCIGVIAAQSISEPMMQIVIDSHHASGAAEDSNKGIDYIKELLKATPVYNMKQVNMKLYVLPEYETDYEFVRKISNEIEMLKFSQFAQTPQVFWEAYGVPRHPKYKHENIVSIEFAKYNPNIVLPSDLTKICARFAIIKEKLIEKNISIEDIYLRLQEQFPNTFIIYNSENAKETIIKIYFRNIAFKKSITKDAIYGYLDQIMNTVVRGVDGIHSSVVKSKNITTIGDDGGISKKQIYYIATNGSNIYKLLLNPYLDPSRMDSNCLIDIYDCYGIEAARSKFIDEFYEQLGKGVTYRHFTNYADEMVWPGYLTSIDRFGSDKRDSSPLMQLSDSDPIRVIEEAAYMNKRDDLQGVSPSLIVGQAPHIGTLYSTIKIDEEMLAENIKQNQKVFEDI